MKTQTYPFIVTPNRRVNLPHPLLPLYSSLREAKIGWDGWRGGLVHNKCSLSIRRLPIRPPARLDLSIWTIFGQEKGRKKGRAVLNANLRILELWS